MLDIILDIACIALVPLVYLIYFKSDNKQTEFYKKELDYLDQILKKMR